MAHGDAGQGGEDGHYDDGERFGFFSRAIVSLMPALQFMPEVIHCND
ncbi:glycogen/starch synthase, partial [Duncaniella muris]